MTYEEFLELTYEESFSPEVAEIIANSPGEYVNSLGRGFNWDYDPAEFLEAIVVHPECNLVTACSIFWTAEPGSYMGEKYVRDDEFMVFVHDRINSGVLAVEPSEYPPISRDIKLQMSYVVEVLVAPSTEEAKRRASLEFIEWGFDPAIVNRTNLGILTFVSS